MNSEDTDQTQDRFVQHTDQMRDWLCLKFYQFVPGISPGNVQDEQYFQRQTIYPEWFEPLVDPQYNS